ncbi:MAG TPA: hypothetical protein VM166_13935 [Gemmatimonadaceae bacterium]|nr:hypothetical protein [Gemmatimonadaceae bacterium]
MKRNRHRIAVFALVGLAGLAGFTRNSYAQGLHPSLYGSTEFDTRGQQFYLLGLYVGMGGLGWSPYFNANAYHLRYPIRTSATTKTYSTLNAFSPTLGLAYASGHSGVSFGVGYSWSDSQDPGAPGAESGGSNGVTASFGAYNNGRSEQALHTQFLSNYNFGSHYLWSRLRGSVPFGRSISHPARIGLEFVGQGGGKEGRTSNSFQVGPTLQYSWSPNFSTTGVVGYKNSGGGSFGRESSAYFKLEFSLSP